MFDLEQRRTIHDAVIIVIRKSLELANAIPPSDLKDQIDIVNVITLELRLAIEVDSYSKSSDADWRFRIDRLLENLSELLYIISLYSNNDTEIETGSTLLRSVEALQFSIRAYEEAVRLDRNKRSLRYIFLRRDAFPAFAALFAIMLSLFDSFGIDNSPFYAFTVVMITIMLVLSLAQSYEFLKRR